MLVTTFKCTTEVRHYPEDNNPQFKIHFETFGYQQFATVGRAGCSRVATLTGIEPGTHILQQPRCTRIPSATCALRRTATTGGVRVLLAHSNLPNRHECSYSFSPLSPKQLTATIKTFN